jgi:hypothetical protein
VVAIFDQLGSDTLASQLPHLDLRGAIRRTRERGIHVHRAVLGYAATFTAPGHVAIHTGAAPRDSGIASNRVFSDARARRISSFDDGEHAVLGHPHAFASPSALRVPAVADVIDATRPASIVVALSHKDRGAIPAGGQHPDLCLWFDASAGGYTTSTWYAQELPAWLVAWQAANPFQAAIEMPWTPHDAAALSRRLGPDDRDGEGAYGFDSSFPHDARGLEDSDAYLSHPGSVDHLLALADEVVTQLGIGTDETPDLLALSISATDYVGHAFGPDSWEYADVLFRADRALGAFLERLEARAGPIAVLITSDHGVAPLVERARERGHPEAARYESETELRVLQAALRERLGPAPGGGEWVTAWVQPYIYLSPTVRDGPERERAIAAIRGHVRTRPGIGMALDARALAQQPVSAPASVDDPMEMLLARSVPRDPPGDVFVLPAEHSVGTEELPVGRGTSHGSPWRYDREVPVIFAGPGVPHLEIEAPEPQCRVAGTIAALVGVEPPPHACGRLGSP